MSQIALPLRSAAGGLTARIVIGSGNAPVVEALARRQDWPFLTAVLRGPPRSGKSLLARWFVESGAGEVLDDAQALDETELFHRWNRAQEHNTPLLIVHSGAPITLPDLASRLGAALHLDISAPDDAMIGDLIHAHAEQRGLILGEGAAAYLVPRCERSYAAIEALVATIDRLSLERKQPPTQMIWRDALEFLGGESQPRLL